MGTLAFIKARKNKQWTQTSNPVMPQEQAIVCPNVRCSKTFSEPIKLTVQANGSPETYHACPYCFSRVKLSDNLKKPPSKTSHSALKKALKETAKDLEKNKPAGCAHFLGYLKTRPKDASIPDECLTCDALMKCM